MSVVELQSEILKYVASNLAVTLSQVAEKFKHADKKDIQDLVSDAAKSGLLKVRDLEGEDPIVSITADGSKKAESTNATRVATKLVR
jgi:siroheme synthase